MSNPLATLGNVKPATRSRAAELAAQFPSLSVMWGYNPGANEHGTGRALDLMVFRDTDLGHDLAAYLWTHRLRLDLTHLIWRQRIRSTVKRPGVWRAMEDRGNGTANHMDHVHVFFGKKSYVEIGASAALSTAASSTPATPSTSSGSSPLASSAPPYPGVQLRRGSRGAHVETVQAQLKARGWTISVDGSYGPGTEKVVRTFQQNKGLKADGVVGPVTWAAIWDLPVT
jgi:hypothetical protein